MRQFDPTPGMVVPQLWSRRQAETGLLLAADRIDPSIDPYLVLTAQDWQRAGIMAWFNPCHPRQDITSCATDRTFRHATIVLRSRGPCWTGGSIACSMNG